jgi:hypothetical protein
MQRRFAAFVCKPRHIVITGRAWHDGGSADAAGDACRRARSGGVVATASIRRWRAGGVSRPALPSSGLPDVIDATRSAWSFAACATGGAAHASATSDTGRRQRFAKRASSWSFRSFRGRRRGGRAAAASIVGTTMAVRHAGIRSHGHSRRRRSKRKRRSGTREDVRLPLPKSDRRPKAADGSRLAGGPGGVQAAPDGRAARRCGSAQRGGGSVTGAPRAGGARANRQA